MTIGSTNKRDGKGMCEKWREEDKSSKATEERKNWDGGGVLN
jgi:hypothetical protein